MKKQFVLGLIAVLCMTGCGKQEKTINKTTNETIEQEQGILKSKKTIYEDDSYTIDEYNGDGSLLLSTMYTPQGKAYYQVVYDYDDLGNLVSKQLGEDGNGYEWDYDEEGKLLEYRDLSGGEVHFRDLYHYDDNGYLVQQDCYYGDGELRYSYIYENDDEGKVLRERQILPDGYEYSTVEYSYYEDGSIKQKAHCRLDGQSSQYYLYDEQGNIVGEAYGVDKMNLCSIYVYGEYGLVSEWKNYIASDKLVRIRYEYDSDGNMIQVVAIDEEGNEEIKKTCTYDGEGHLLTSDDPKGYYYEAEYDEMGNVIYEHNVCTDVTRNAGTYDTTLYYEYTY